MKTETITIAIPIEWSRTDCFHVAIRNRTNAEARYRNAPASQTDFSRILQLSLRPPVGIRAAGAPPSP